MEINFSYFLDSQFWQPSTSSNFSLMRDVLNMKLSSRGHHETDLHFIPSLLNDSWHAHYFFLIFLSWYSKILLQRLYSFPYPSTQSTSYGHNHWFKQNVPLHYYRIINEIGHIVLEVILLNVFIYWLLWF